MVSRQGWAIMRRRLLQAISMCVSLTDKIQTNKDIVHPDKEMLITNVYYIYNLLESIRDEYLGTTDNTSNTDILVDS